MPQSLAYREWYATRMSGTLRVVSTFYESVIRAMVGGTGPENYGDGDVVTPNYSHIFEVKGAMSSNAFLVRSSQLHEHERRLREEFLFSGSAFFYCFFGYYPFKKTKGSRAKGSKRCSLIRSAVRNGRGYEFLAKRTRDLWIVPLPIVHELFDNLRATIPRNGRPLFPPTPDCEPVFGVRLYRREFHTLARTVPTQHGTVVIRHRPNSVKCLKTTFRITVFSHPDVQLPTLKGVIWDEPRT